MIKKEQTSHTVQFSQKGYFYLNFLVIFVFGSVWQPLFFILISVRFDMIGHKASLNKFKNIEITSSTFSDHKGLKQETKPKGKKPKHSKSWRLNSMLLNNEWVKMISEKKSKSFWKQRKMNSQQPKTYGTPQRQSWERRRFIAIQAYLKKIETFQTNNLTLCVQELKEQQQRQPRASRRKEITKIGAELNDMETKTKF